jgi:putative mycofactocin binding protein MftB
MIPAIRYRLAEGISVRPERFGALVYQHRSRNLLFLGSRALGAFVLSLSDAQPRARALDGFCRESDLAPDAEEQILSGLARLERLGVVVRADGATAVA